VYRKDDPVTIKSDLLPTTPALCRFSIGDSPARLGWITGGAVADLTGTAEPWFADLGALLQTLGRDGAGQSLQALIDAALPAASRIPLQDGHLLPPIDRQEVWAAGVTYERSREARMSESEYAADMYWRVYEAERPELFFKADGRRVSGQGGRIHVRADSRWTVPEPELTVLLDPMLRIVGFTIGNDVSARDIEGENPLYLPQAKVFAGNCALGPCIVPASDIPNPLDLRLSCSISRGGRVLWEDETNTARLHRSLTDLVDYLGREDTYPHGALLMTGTCLVPPDTLSLQVGDVVSISIDALGTLRNEVA
jgi:2-dehydro-3-deoxy-D-arabinonate dehydratase